MTTELEIVAADEYFLLKYYVQTALAAPERSVQWAKELHQMAVGLHDRFTRCVYGFRLSRRRRQGESMRRLLEYVDEQLGINPLVLSLIRQDHEDLPVHTVIGYTKVMLEMAVTNLGQVYTLELLRDAMQDILDYRTEICSSAQLNYLSNMLPEVLRRLETLYSFGFDEPEHPEYMNLPDAQWEAHCISWTGCTGTVMWETEEGVRTLVVRSQDLVFPRTAQTWAHVVPGERLWCSFENGCLSVRLADLEELIQSLEASDDLLAKKELTEEEQETLFLSIFKQLGLVWVVSHERIREFNFRTWHIRIQYDGLKKLGFDKEEMRLFFETSNIDYVRLWRTVNEKLDKYRNGLTFARRKVLEHLLSLTLEKLPFAEEPAEIKTLQELECYLLSALKA